MNLSSGSSSTLSRRLVLLAPPGADVNHFAEVSYDGTEYEHVLAEAQRFRGRLYVAERKLTPLDLSFDGRHIQSSDYKSWHLLTVDEEGAVQACARVLVHDEKVRFPQLMVAQSALAQSDIWGPRLRKAVESEIKEARRRDLRFAELGGWAISRGLRCTTEAARMVLAGYALGETLGGVLGISTANLDRSAPLLRKVGAKSLEADGVELPSYYEPHYHAQLEIVRFDSSQPNPQFLPHIAQCRASLSGVPVICPRPAAGPWQSLRTDFASLYRQPPERSGWQWGATAAAVVFLALFQALSLQTPDKHGRARISESSMISMTPDLGTSTLEVLREEAPPASAELLKELRSRPRPVQVVMQARVVQPRKRFVPPAPLYPVYAQERLDTALPKIPTTMHLTMPVSALPKLKPPKRPMASRVFRAMATPFRFIGAAFR